MSFATKLFGGKSDNGAARLQAEAQARNAAALEAATAAQTRQAETVADEQAKVDKAAEAQRRIRRGGGRGLLKFTEGGNDLLGTSGA